MNRSIEVESHIPVITRETTQFPPGGATVRIEEGVLVERGSDFGDVAGRGVAFSRDDCSPKPLGEPTRTQSAGIANMNA